MAKRRKKNPIRNLDQSSRRSDENDSFGGRDWSAGLRFELEEDAEDLFLKALEDVDPRKVKHSKELNRTKAIGTSPSRKAGKSQPESLDLHGLTLEQAEQKILLFMNARLSSSKEATFTVRVITGKGRNSGPGGGVLAKEVHAFVRHQFKAEIVRITDSPADVTIAGVPWRGHFDVTLRGRR